MCLNFPDFEAGRAYELGAYKKKRVMYDKPTDSLIDTVDCKIAGRDNVVVTSVPLNVLDFSFPHQLQGRGIFGEES